MYLVNQFEQWSYDVFRALLSQARNSTAVSAYTVVFVSNVAFYGFQDSNDPSQTISVCIFQSEVCDRGTVPTVALLGQRLYL